MTDQGNSGNAFNTNTATESRNVNPERITAPASFEQLDTSVSAGLLSKPQERRIEIGDGIPPLLTVDSSTERRITRKIDIRIVPTIMWVYLMNMMDRVNIGNARLFGLEEDLGMDPAGPQFQIAVGVLFITYCLFETPSNMIIKKLHPGRYLAGLTICWGLVATFSAWVNSLGALVACRLLLGLFEAGFFPGVILYLSTWYGRKSLGLRISLFFCTAAIAGFAGGMVAYGIASLDGALGWRAWRWIILINGIPTIITGIIMPFILPDSPKTATFLTDEDRADLVSIQASQLGRAYNLRNLDKKDAIDALKDWTTWVYCIAIFPCLIMLYGFVVLVPTIINGLGRWTAAEVQAVTAPIYIVGAIIYVFIATLNDKTQTPSYFIMGGLISGMTGYAMLISNAGVAVSYAGCFFVGIGLFTSAGLSCTWATTNNPRYGKRAIAGGLQLTVGNSAGVVAPFLFNRRDAPTYRVGYGSCMGMLFVAFILNLVLHLYFGRQNELRQRGDQDYLKEGKSEIELEAMGERSPDFRFAT